MRSHEVGDVTLTLASGRAAEAGRSGRRAPGADGNLRAKRPWYDN